MCDYAGSDAQSISSRLSMLSVEAEQHPFTRSKSKNKQFRKATTYRSEDLASPSQSSDYEDQDDQPSVTVHTVRKFVSPIFFVLTNFVIIFF